jgi:hypothetical protein
MTSILIVALATHRPGARIRRAFVDLMRTCTACCQPG